MERLTAHIRPRRDLGGGDVAAMHRLFAEYYDATSPARFRSDLSGKDYVIELRDGAALKGFSTVALMDFEVAGEAAQAIYSGDTVIDRRYWGEQALARTFCRFAGAVKGLRPDLPLYWFLISKGHRTYRYLSVFAKDFFPNPDRATPPDMQARIDLLASRSFGEAYCAELGLVRFADSQGHLKPQWASIREDLRGRTPVRFFLDRNPRFHTGEELCCITPLETGNLRSFARKAFLEGLHDERATPFLPEHRRNRGTLPQLALAGAGDTGTPAPGHTPA